MATCKVCRGFNWADPDDLCSMSCTHCIGGYCDGECCEKEHDEDYEDESWDEDYEDESWDEGAEVDRG